MVFLRSAFASDGDAKEIGRTTEKEINVVLSSSFGNVSISKGEPEKIVVADGIFRSEENSGISVEYSIRNRVGYLELSLGQDDEGDGHKSKSLNVKGGKWTLRYSNAIPISFDVELGVGKGDFDLSGLQVKDLNLSTGASDVNLTFDEPNKATIDNINIDLGVSKFHGHNLGNANFKRMKIQGGVGTYTLDFSGALQHEVDVDVEVGLGLLLIVVPDNVGAKIQCEESWISRVDCDSDFHSTGDNEYSTDNYSSAAGKMNITIEAGMGSVKIRRR